MILDAAGRLAREYGKPRASGDDPAAQEIMNALDA